MAVLTGYAAKFDSPSLDLGGFTETIRKGAFSRSLKERDVFAFANHSSDNVLGRTQSGTLQLSEDNVGLRFRLDVPDTATGNDLATLVGRGDLSGMSFGFGIPDSTGEIWFEGRDGLLRRELLDLELVEVSTTPLPAYPSTTLKLDQGMGGRSAPDLKVVGGTQSNAQRRRLGKKRLELGRMRKKAMGFR